MPDCKEYLLLLKSDDKEVVREGAFRAGEENCVEAVPKLAELLQTNHLGIQEAAESSLRKIGGKEVVAAVLPLLRSDDAPVRNLSMDILREVGNQDLPSLFKLIYDDDADIRIFISDILGSCNNVLAVEPLCDALLKDPEVNVRYQAAVSLGSLGMVEAVNCLNKAIEDEEWVQYSVIEALTKIGHVSSVDAMVRALDTASDLVGSMIIEALGEMGNAKAVTMLLKRLDSASLPLRNKIVKAVVNILGGKSLALLTEAERTKLSQYLIVALDDEETEVQDAAIQGLAYVGDDEATRLILSIAAALNPDTKQDRLQTIVGYLAQIGLNDALKQGVLGDDPEVARVAVQVLARVDGDGSVNAEVCDVLMQAFWNVGLYIQRQIITVLAEKADQSAVDFFVRVLDEHEDGTVLKGAIFMLGERLHLAEVGGKIFELLGHQYDDVKEAALEGCVAIGGDEMVERFHELFQGEDPMGRLMATFALGKMGVSEHLDVLNSALADEIPDIRKVAVEALAGTCDKALINGSLVSLLKDENKDVRLAVVQVLGNCYSEEFVPHLVEALDDEDDWVRIRAVDALGEHSESQAVPKLLELLESPNRFVVMKVIEALGEIGGEKAFQALLGVTSSDDYEMVRAAEEAIAKIQ